MPICDVIKSHSLGQVATCGKLEASVLQSGFKTAPLFGLMYSTWKQEASSVTDRHLSPSTMIITDNTNNSVLVMPSRDFTMVRSLERDSHACTIARAGDNIVVSLQGIDGGRVMASGVLCHPDFPVSIATHMELKVLILDVTMPILVEIHIHHAKEATRVVRILSLLDPKIGKVTKRAPRYLIAKQSAVIESFFLVSHRQKKTAEMEASKMRLFTAVVMMIMAVSAVQNVEAAEAPAPSPTSDAAVLFIPTAFASLMALAFGLLF
ncbi:hypothetical protein HHK36_012090 [Tetracentron sinense]|uniref:Uncharacterized protein n=1 Tax=Tetracentron sinense TaxID=13715 RepID=A0A834ZE99_TETSI|nr:hypothetical protein HHK36_012090 [Tetracentron sinense]